MSGGADREAVPHSGLTSNETLADPLEEARRVVLAGHKAGLTIRALGGLAIALVAPSAKLPGLARNYADIDFFIRKRERLEVARLFPRLGYTPHDRFNAFHGQKRLMFFDHSHDRRVDVFVGTFEMCHRLELEERLALHPLSLSPADLLLTKLQIVEINEKDLVDVIALLADAPIGEMDEGAINAAYIARVCAGDWGLYTTVTDNLACLNSSIPSELPPPLRERVTSSIRELEARLLAEPKTARWRARMGRRIRWYELPDETA